MMAENIVRTDSESSINWSIDLQTLVLISAVDDRQLRFSFSDVVKYFLHSEKAKLELIGQDPEHKVLTFSCKRYFGQSGISYFTLFANGVVSEVKAQILHAPIADKVPNKFGDTIKKKGLLTTSILCSDEISLEGGTFSYKYKSYNKTYTWDMRDVRFRPLGGNKICCDYFQNPGAKKPTATITWNTADTSHSDHVWLAQLHQHQQFSKLGRSYKKVEPQAKQTFNPIMSDCNFSNVSDISSRTVTQFADNSSDQQNSHGHKAIPVNLVSVRLTELAGITNGFLPEICVSWTSDQRVTADSRSVSRGPPYVWTFQPPTKLINDVPNALELFLHKLLVEVRDSRTNNSSSGQIGSALVQIPLEFSTSARSSIDIVCRVKEEYSTEGAQRSTGTVTLALQKQAFDLQPAQSIGKKHLIQFNEIVVEMSGADEVPRELLVRIFFKGNVWSTLLQTTELVHRVSWSSSGLCWFSDEQKKLYFEILEVTEEKGHILMGKTKIYTVVGRCSTSLGNLMSSMKVFRENISLTERLMNGGGPSAGKLVCHWSTSHDIGIPSGRMRISVSAISVTLLGGSVEGKYIVRLRSANETFFDTTEAVFSGLNVCKWEVDDVGERSLQCTIQSTLQSDEEEVQFKLYKRVDAIETPVGYCKGTAKDFFAQGKPAEMQVQLDGPKVKKSKFRFIGHRYAAPNMSVKMTVQSNVLGVVENDVQEEAKLPVLLIRQCLRPEFLHLQCLEQQLTENDERLFASELKNVVRMLLPHHSSGGIMMAHINGMHHVVNKGSHAIHVPFDSNFSLHELVPFSVAGSSLTMRLLAKDFAFSRELHNVHDHIRLLLSTVTEYRSLQHHLRVGCAQIPRSVLLLRALAAYHTCLCIRDTPQLYPLPPQDLQALVAQMRQAPNVSVSILNAVECLNTAISAPDKCAWSDAAFPMLEQIGSHLHDGVFDDDDSSELLENLVSDERNQQASTELFLSSTGTELWEDRILGVLETFEAARRATEISPTFENCFKLLVNCCCINKLLNLNLQRVDVDVDMHDVSEELQRCLESEGFGGSEDVFGSVNKTDSLAMVTMCRKLLHGIQSLSYRHLIIRLDRAYELADRMVNMLVECDFPQIMVPLVINRNESGNNNNSSSTAAVATTTSSSNISNASAEEATVEDSLCNNLLNSLRMFDSDPDDVEIVTEMMSDESEANHSAPVQKKAIDASRVCLVCFDKECLTKFSKNHSTNGSKDDSKHSSDPKKESKLDKKDDAKLFEKDYVSDNISCLKFRTPEERIEVLNQIQQEFKVEKRTDQGKYTVDILISPRVYSLLRRQIRMIDWSVKRLLSGSENTIDLDDAVPQRISAFLAELHGFSKFQCVNHVADQCKTDIIRIVSETNAECLGAIKNTLAKFIQTGSCLLDDNRREPACHELLSVLQRLHAVAGVSVGGAYVHNPLQVGTTPITRCQETLLNALRDLNTIDCGVSPCLILAHMSILADLFQEHESQCVPRYLRQKDPVFACKLLEFQQSACDYFTDIFVFKEFETARQCMNYADCFRLLEVLKDAVQFWRVRLKKVPLLSSKITNWLAKSEAHEREFFEFIHRVVDECEGRVATCFVATPESVWSDNSSSNISGSNCLQISCFGDVHNLKHMLTANSNADANIAAMGENMQILSKLSELEDFCGLDDDHHGALKPSARLRSVMELFNVKVNELSDARDLATSYGTMMKFVVIDKLATSNQYRMIPAVIKAHADCCDKLKQFYSGTITTVTHICTKSSLSQTPARDISECLVAVTSVSEALDACLQEKHTKLFAMVPDIRTAAARLVEEVNSMYLVARRYLPTSSAVISCKNGIILNSFEFIYDFLCSYQIHEDKCQVFRQGGQLIGQFQAHLLSKVDELSAAANSLALSSEEFLELCLSIDWLDARHWYTVVALANENGFGISWADGRAEKWVAAAASLKDRQQAALNGKPIEWFGCVSSFETVKTTFTKLNYQKVMLLASLKWVNQFVTEFQVNQGLFTSSATRGFQIFQETLDSNARQLLQVLWNSHFIPSYQAVVVGKFQALLDMFHVNDDDISLAVTAVGFEQEEIDKWSKHLTSFAEIGEYFTCLPEAEPVISRLRIQSRQLSRMAVERRDNSLQSIVRLLNSNNITGLVDVLRSMEPGSPALNGAKEMLCAHAQNLTQIISVEAQNFTVCPNDIVSTLNAATTNNLAIENGMPWPMLQRFVVTSYQLLSLQARCAEWIESKHISGTVPMLRQAWVFISGTEAMLRSTGTVSPMNQISKWIAEYGGKEEFSKVYVLLSCLDAMVDKFEELDEAFCHQTRPTLLQSFYETTVAYLEDGFTLTKSFISKALTNIRESTEKWAGVVLSCVEDDHLPDEDLTVPLCKGFSDVRLNGMFSLLTTTFKNAGDITTDYSIDNLCEDMLESINTVTGPVSKETFTNHLLSEKICKSLLALVDVLPVASSAAIRDVADNITNQVKELDELRMESSRTEISAFDRLGKFKHSLCVFMDAVIKRSRINNAQLFVPLTVIIADLAANWDIWNRFARFPAYFDSTDELDESTLPGVFKAVILLLVDLFNRLMKELDGLETRTLSTHPLEFVVQYGNAFARLYEVFLNSRSVANGNERSEVVPRSDSLIETYCKCIETAEANRDSSMRNPRISTADIVNNSLRQAIAKLLSIFCDRTVMLKDELTAVTDVNDESVNAGRIAGVISNARQLLQVSIRYDADRMDLQTSFPQFFSDLSTCSYEHNKTIFDHALDKWFKQLSDRTMAVSLNQAINSSPQTRAELISKIFRSWVALFVVIMDSTLRDRECNDAERREQIESVLKTSVALVTMECIKLRKELSAQFDDITKQLRKWLFVDTEPNAGGSEVIKYDKLFNAVARLQAFSHCVGALAVGNIVNSRENNEEYKAVLSLATDLKHEIMHRIDENLIQEIVKLIRSCIAQAPKVPEGNDDVQAFLEWKLFKENVTIFVSRGLVELRHLADQYLNKDDFHAMLFAASAAILEDLESLPHIYIELVRGIYDYLYRLDVGLREGVGESIRCSQEFSTVFGRFSQELLNEKFLLPTNELLDQVKIEDMEHILAKKPYVEDVERKERYGNLLEKVKRDYEELCKQGRQRPYEARTDIVRRCKHWVTHFLLFEPNPEQHPDDPRPTHPYELCVDLITSIFVMWTLLYSGKMNRLIALPTEDNMNVRDLRPHDGQILSLLILFDGVDITRPTLQTPTIVKVPNQFTQIGTGQGKSVTLAVASIVLALLGVTVDCICYSEYLSDRDHEHFRDLFCEFGVSKFIFYDTYERQCEHFVRERTATCGGDVSTVIRHLVDTNHFPKNKEQVRCVRGKFARAVFSYRDIVLGLNMFRCVGNLVRKHAALFDPDRPRNRVVLLDEVDKFFSQDFLGSQFRITTVLTYSEAVAKLFLFLWQHRTDANFQTYEQIVPTEEYQNCLTAYAFESTEWCKLLAEAVKAMLIDRRLVKLHPYIVQNMDIAYLISGTDKYSTDIRYRYQTSFAFLSEFEHVLSPENLLSHGNYLRIQLLSGTFSFAEIPKKYLEHGSIIGVTGTMSTLTRRQIETVCDDYDIRKFVTIANAFRSKELTDDTDRQLKFLKDVPIARQPLRDLSASLDGSMDSICSYVHVDAHAFSPLGASLAPWHSEKSFSPHSPSKSLKKRPGLQIVPRGLHHEDHAKHQKQERRMANQHFEAILMEILAVTTGNNRSALIFFSDIHSLDDFAKYLLDQKATLQFAAAMDHIEINIMKPTDSNNKRSIAVRAACLPHVVTLATRDFGRGVDFVIYSQALIRDGGMHVIQTFLSKEFCEEIQIQGRTCRQDNPGSYVLILAEEELVSQMHIDLEELFADPQQDDHDLCVSLTTTHRPAVTDRLVYERLHNIRVNEYDAAYHDKVVASKGTLFRKHEASVAFVDCLCQSQTRQVCDFLLDVNRCETRSGSSGVTSPIALGVADLTPQIPPTVSRTAILLDATRSMTHMIEHTKQSIVSILNDLALVLGQQGVYAQIQVKFFVYRNYSSGPDLVCETSEWDWSSEQIYDFLSGISAQGGNKREAIEAALQLLNDEIQENRASNNNGVFVTQALLIGDAGPNDDKRHEKLSGWNEIENNRYWYRRDHRLPTDFWKTTRFPYPTSFPVEFDRLLQVGVPVHTFFVEPNTVEGRTDPLLSHYREQFHDIATRSLGKACTLNNNPSAEDRKTFVMLVAEAILRDVARDEDERRQQELCDAFRSHVESSHAR